MAQTVDKIIELARQEWDFFGKQEFDLQGRTIRRGRKETDEGFWQHVGVYWLEGTGKHLTGKNDDFPWSATFVSFVMRKAGAGDRFKYSAQHSVYIRAAIVAKTKTKTAAGMWGFRLSERAPEPGDLICYAREPGVGYDTPSADYKSHADIVVARHDDEIEVIGGNVGNSVTLKHLAVDDDGLLIDPQFEWFAVLQNRLDQA
jgi:hypothetical protein